MKKLIVLIAALACITTFGRAEQPSVNVSSRLLADNSLGFFADIDGFGTFTIQLKFNSVANAAVAAEQLFTVTGSGQFFTLEPEDASEPVEAEYYYNWLQGELNPAVQPDFIYRLPFNAGISTSPKRLSNYEAGMMRGNFVDFTVWEFPLSKDGTIFATRAGEVIMVNGFYPPVEGVTPEEAFYIDRGNSIYVQHTDGTIGVYSVLDNGSLMVAPGDTVYPDTPLAKAGAIESDRYALRFSLYYFATNRSKLHADMFSQTYYLNPVFSTEFGAIRLDEKDADTVTAQVDKKLVAAEKPRKGFWKRLFGGKK